MDLLRIEPSDKINLAKDEPSKFDEERTCRFVFLMDREMHAE